MLCSVVVVSETWCVLLWRRRVGCVPLACRRSPRRHRRWRRYGCRVYCARAIKLATRGEAAVKQMSTKGFVQLEYVYPPAAQSGGSTSPGRAAFSTSLFIDATRQRRLGVDLQYWTGTQFVRDDRCSCWRRTEFKYYKCTYSLYYDYYLWRVPWWLSEASWQRIIV